MVGIAPASGYFGPITRANVNASAVVTTPGTTTTTSTNSGLSGGDGDIQNIDQTTSGTETTLSEGSTEDVLGFDIEADDNSDLMISSIKVEITTDGTASTRLSRYLDEVVITFDGDEVGSEDASDFSRDGDLSTATISLDDVVIEAGEEERFYVTFTANDVIDTDELAAELDVEITRVRFTDASGITLSIEPTAPVTETVDFEDGTADDDARVKNDSSTRSAGFINVDANTTSDDEEIFSFKIDVDDESSDLVVLDIPVEIEIVNADGGAALDVEAMIRDIYLEIEGDRFDDFDYDDTSVAAAATETITVTFTIDEGDLEIAEGDVADATLFIEFDDQDGNYAVGTTLEASVTGADITAENPEGDAFDVDGTATGEVQTLQLSVANIDGFDWSPASTGTILDFYFTVEAEDEDFSVLSADMDFVSTLTTGGGALASNGVLTLSTGDADEVAANTNYKVLDGDTATFRLRWTMNGATVNGDSLEVTVDSVAGQEVSDDEKVSPTVIKNVNS